VRDLGTQYPLINKEWAEVRMRMLALVVREFPDDGWVPGALENVAGDLKLRKMAPLAALPVSEAVMARVEVARAARGVASWIEAETRCAEGSEAQFALALAALDRIAAAPGDLIGLEQQAAERANTLRRVMPGAPLPDSRTAEWALKDADEQELVLTGYKGRVLLIDVFDVQDEGWLALVPSRRALRSEMAGKPFELVGLCATRLSKQVFEKTLSEASIDWRCGALMGWQHPYVTTLMAIHRPATTILVDADGQIRARDRSWDEMTRSRASSWRRLRPRPPPRTSRSSPASERRRPRRNCARAALPFRALRRWRHGTEPAMTTTKDTKFMDTIVSLCKRRGFVFQASEIYGGIGNTYDYGPLGVELKRRVKEPGGRAW
jgi:hypothetical protein